MRTQLPFVATCPKGVEALLADELRGLGVEDVRETRAAVSFSGTLPDAYRVCLWSRVASRVLLVLAEFPADSAEALYEGVAAVPWADHISPDGTIAIDAVGTTSGLAHSGFAARKAKDAVVDRLRDETGRRPSVDLVNPDVRLNVRFHREQATLSLDLAGEPLHRRGYRTEGEQAAAPLKENLAAAILMRSGWPGIAASGGALGDPMCGSGTLLVEGALMAGDRAAGLLRARWGFEGWLGHDAVAWGDLLDEADERAEAGTQRIPAVFGADCDPAVIELARACARRAGLGDAIALEAGDVGAFAPPATASGGLVVTNPPYGVRLGDASGLAGLYATLGSTLVERFSGWTAALFTAEPELAKATRLRSRKSYTLYNGTIETGLYLFDVSPGNTRAEVKRSG